ncbi:sulfotransferase family protein [Chengkuizengella sp. SCS-71B]|uniref:sulfotransferase family protein n=1 Tax=Chengkuizengella sp. SCS-71B TaxID=3115290 RepID=UPI0032C218A4
MTKIFCIGRNKTGTTSLQKAFRDLGYTVGNQQKAELLMDDYIYRKNFDSIINYCKTADVFQDIPFSLPETYKHLDKAYPDSKFILSIRDNSEQWYSSITRFHAKLFGKGKIPTIEVLKNARYLYKGYIWKIFKEVYGASENDPYNKEVLIKNYEKHNREIINYFKYRPNDLLVINLSQPNSYKKFCEFLNIKSPYNKFPWENKT